MRKLLVLVKISTFCFCFNIVSFVTLYLFNVCLNFRFAELHFTEYCHPCFPFFFLSLPQSADAFNTLSILTNSLFYLSLFVRPCLKVYFRFTFSIFFSHHLSSSVYFSLQSICSLSFFCDFLPLNYFQPIFSFINMK